MNSLHTRPIQGVEIADGFWRDKIELVRTQVLPWQWRAINDEIADAAPSYCMRNFRIAGSILRGEIQRIIHEENVFQPLPEDKASPEDTFYGFAFQDSDLYKWLEAAAYSLAQHRDAELEKRCDEAIDTICAAQQEDGYLDTYFIIRNPAAAFTNLRDYHELYCFGHLAEGAVAYYYATGKDKLLNAALRFADCIGRRIGREEGQLRGYPGHEEAELALIRLYEASGCEKYLDMARYFIDERGKRPYYFDIEHNAQAKLGDSQLAGIDFAGSIEKIERYTYQQAHRPVRCQDEAVGHAVRAVYLYSAMADAARLSHDSGLYESCRRLWESITTRKMYVTGAIGATHIGEAFSHDYDLPSDTAYAETCAAVGLVFFAARMLRCEPKGEYADVLEHALYNGVLSGMALDGRSFFYVNPLECVPEDCRRDERKQHIKPVRQKWFGCACCPPNIARLIGAIGQYAFSQSDDTLYIHTPVSASLPVHLDVGGNTRSVTVRLSCAMPLCGKGSITAEGLRVGESIRLALHLPQWAGSDSRIDGTLCTQLETRNGYITLTLSGGESIDFDFTMPARFVRSSERVRESAGMVTLSRGPLIYCAEEADNGKNLHLLRVDTASNVEETQARICGCDTVMLETDALREERVAQGLYTYDTPPRVQRVRMKWIPYYMWANRGENEMRVWCRE